MTSTCTSTPTTHTTISWLSSATVTILFLRKWMWWRRSPTWTVLSVPVGTQVGSSRERGCKQANESQIRIKRRSRTALRSGLYCITLEVCRRSWAGSSRSAIREWRCWWSPIWHSRGCWSIQRASRHHMWMQGAVYQDLQGLSECVYRGDREKVWCERKGTQEKC